jgi:hypothetical protein
MPIHDQSYRHYGGLKAVAGRSWTVIARAGLLGMLRKRAFLGLLIFAWSPFVVRAVQIYVTANYPQVAMFAPTAETFRQFLEQQDFFVLHHHDLRRRRPHRQRSPRQCPADLPVEAVDAQASTSPARRRSCSRSWCSSRWCRPCCSCSCR